MALTFPKYSVAGIGVPGTLAGTINSGDSTGATFTSSTALTNWLDMTGANFANPIYVAVDYNPGTGTHTEEKMLVTVNTTSQTFTIVSRMVDYPSGTAPTPPSHSAGVSIVPIFTGTQLAELSAAVQLLKAIILNTGGTTTPQPILVGSGTASSGSSPALAAADHNHYIPSATLATWLAGIGNLPAAVNASKTWKATSTSAITGITGYNNYLVIAKTQFNPTGNGNLNISATVNGSTVAASACSWAGGNTNAVSLAGFDVVTPGNSATFSAQLVISNTATGTATNEELIVIGFN